MPATKKAIVMADVQKEEPKPAPPLRWPRYDPSRDIYLCESCWNDGNWKHHCARGFCECCRCNVEKPKKVKFAARGQTSIPMDDCLFIGPKS